MEKGVTFAARQMRKRREFLERLEGSKNGESGKLDCVFQKKKALELFSKIIWRKQKKFYLCNPKREQRQ